MPTIRLATYGMHAGVRFLCNASILLKLGTPKRITTEPQIIIKKLHHI